MLIAEKIILRPMRRDDIKKTIEWRNDFDLRYLAMYHPFPVTEELEEEWIDGILKDKKNKTITFAIEEKDTNNFIGYIQLKEINWINRNCYFGIIIGDKDSQGKGYGKEALKLVIDYAFNILNLLKVTLEVIEINERAINLYKSFGFVIEGKLKNHFFWNNEYHDVLIMSIFKNNSY